MKSLDSVAKTDATAVRLSSDSSGADGNRFMHVRVERQARRSPDAVYRALRMLPFFAAIRINKLRVSIPSKVRSRLAPPNSG
jgi:hypothetical protein